MGISSSTAFGKTMTAGFATPADLGADWRREKKIRATRRPTRTATST
jgi:hypothetical protein